MTREHQTSTHSDAISLDRTLKLLAHPHRRALLHYLAAKSAESIQFQTLVTHLSSDEMAQRDSESPDGHRQELAVQLHHVHLPALAEAHLIDYDHSTGDIHYHGDGRVETLLDFLAATKPPE